MNMELTNNTTDRAILVEIKSVYGKEMIYPVCQDSKTLADIAGSKTLTRQTLHQITKLGYKIGVQYAPGVITPFNP